MKKGCILVFLLLCLPVVCFGKIKLDFQGVGFSDFSKFVSEISGRVIAVGPGCEGLVTVNSAGDIDEKQVYSVFLAVVQVMGYSFVDRDGVVLISSAKDAVKDDLGVRSVGVVVVDEGVGYKIAEKISSLYGEGVKVVADGGFIAYRIEPQKKQEIEGLINSMVSRIDNKKEEIKTVTLDSISFEEVKGMLEGVLDEGEKVVGGGNMVVLKTRNNQRYEEIIRAYDVRKKQIYLEVLIVELQTVDGLAFGVDWSAVGSAGGLLYGVAIDGWWGHKLSIDGLKAVISASKKDQGINVLSNPQVIAIDGKQSLISVGKNIPYQTKTQATQTGESNLNLASAYYSYDYKDVGKIVKIKPKVKGEDIEVEMLVEVSDVLSSTNDRPTLTKKSVEVNCEIKKDTVLVIGGLIEDKKTSSSNGVPLLRDVPLIGFLFDNKQNSKEKTSLYVFVSYKIIDNPGAINGLYDEKRG